MGRKSTKKIGKIILIIIASLLVLDLTIVGLAFVPSIQTAIVNKITTSVSEKWGSEISMKDVRITPTLKFIVHDFRIQDHHHNDMIYVGTVSSRLRSINLKPFKLRLGNTTFDKANVVLRTYKGEESVNISIWAQKFKKEKKKKELFLISAKNLKLKHSRFVIINDEKRVVFNTDNQPDIDYGYFELTDIDMNADKFKILGPSVSGKFKHLALNQYGGFSLKDSKFDFLICDSTLSFKNMKAVTEHSTIDFDFAFKYKDWTSYKNFTDSIRIVSTIRPSTVCMSDVACFAPALKGMDETFAVTADRFNGPINDFSIINLVAGWGLNNNIHGDLAIKNLTDFQNAHIVLDLDSTSINVPELANFHLPKGKTIPINKTLAKLGQTALYATFMGSPSIFNATVSANTNLGKLYADLSTLESDGHMHLQGSASSPSLNLAMLTNNYKVLGSTNCSLTIDGDMESAELTAENFKTLQMHISGDVNRIDLLKYPLRNLKLEGDYQNKLYDVTLTANDPNLECDILTQLDLSHELPYLQGNISLDHFTLGKIANTLPPIDSATAKGIDKVLLTFQKSPDFNVSFDNFMINLSGNNLNNINGYLGCDNIRIFNNTDSMLNDRLRLTTINTESTHKYILSSNFASASIETSYLLNEVKDSLQNIAHNFFPTLIAAVPTHQVKKATENEGNNYLNAHITTYNTRMLLKLLMPKFFIASQSTIDIAINEADGSQDLITANIPYCGMRQKFIVRNLRLNGDAKEQHQLDIDLQSDSLSFYINKSPLVFKAIDFKASSNQSHINYKLDWLNKFNSPSTPVSTFAGNIELQNIHDMVLQFKDSHIYLEDSNWVFSNDNSVHIENNLITVQNLKFSHDKSYILLDGDYSLDKKPSNLAVQINKIDMDFFNPLLNGMSLGGDLSANINLRNNNKSTFIIGKILSNNFAFNESEIGDLFLMAGWDQGKSNFMGGIFNSDVDYNANTLEQYTFNNFRSEKQIIANIKGQHDNDKKRLVANAKFDTLPADFLTPFLSSFSDHINGTASGDLTFCKTPDSTYFDGTVHVIDANLGIAPLGTSYIVQNQDIRFNPQGIFFDHMLIKDSYDNTGYMDGSIKHNFFKDMMLDLHITTDRILVLNTPKDATSVFYGTGFAAGKVDITGPSNDISFVGPNLTTLEGTRIVLQASSANSANQSNIIRFKPKETTNTSETEYVVTPKDKSSLNFDFTFNVSNNSNIVLFIESIGGTMNARADGRFQLMYNDNDNLNLNGALTLHSGDFKVSLFNVVNQRFTLVPGGNILFDGPLENMVVNISAYKSTKTSLTNIISQEYLTGNGVPVNAYMHLNGALMQHIEPTFSFELPNSSEETRNLFYTTIDTNNKENITKQFAYFLLTNNFMPNDMFSSDRAGSNLGSSGLNLFSNIVNNMLSNLMDNRNSSFGITYNQATETSSAEYGVTANTNILKDRVMMETSIGYYDDKETQGFNNMYGDFTVEYNINPAGTWKLKAYTYVGERDENYYTYDAQINYTAGVALAFKQEFNSPTRRKNRVSKNKKSKSKNNEQQ